MIYCGVKGGGEGVTFFTKGSDNFKSRARGNAIEQSLGRRKGKRERG